MAPPRLKTAKKKRDSVELVDKDDFLAAADSQEEAMGKHRHGDTAKAVRFVDRAIDIYSQGLAKFPRDFDLAYNKARLELEKATDDKLSSVLKVPVLDVLRQALRSHHYARDLNPTHADTLFNMAQVLTSMAEVIAEDDGIDDSEAVQCTKQALEILTRCFEVQQADFTKNRAELERAMRETAENPTEQIDSGQATTTPSPEPQSISEEEQWAFIEEPVTAMTLFETIVAQIEALTALCSILNNSLASSPGSGHASATALSWIHPYSDKLLGQTLPTLINENSILKSQLFDVMLPRAVFMSNFLELSFRLSTINVEQYKLELNAAFTHHGLDPTNEHVLSASAGALVSFSGALGDHISTGASNDTAASLAALRWKALIEAQSRQLSLSKIPILDKSTIASTHSLRGDISLHLQILAYPPAAHPQAAATTPQLLKHAEVYYRNAWKLFGSTGRPADEEEKSVCELRGAVVSVLQQVTTDQAAAGSSSGQDNSATMVARSASVAQIERALESVVRAKGSQWVKDQIGEMVDEGIIMPQVFSALMQH